MMKDGLLGEEYILPFVKAMQGLAEANGAYEKALKKLGTVENRLKSSTGFAAARIAEAGYTKGLINLYEELMKAMNDNGETLTRMGKIYEKIFNGLAVSVQYVAKWIEALFRSIESLYVFARDNPLTSLVVSVGALTTMFMNMPNLLRIVGGALLKAFSAPLVVVTGIITLLDQIRAIFDENLIGVGENANASAEDRKIAAAKFRTSSGIGTEKDQKLLAGMSAERINQAVANNGGIGGVLSGYTMQNQASWAKNQQFQQGKADSTPLLEAYLDLLKKPAQIYFTITGSDPEETSSAVIRKLDEHYDMSAEARR